MSKMCIRRSAARSYVSAGAFVFLAQLAIGLLLGLGLARADQQCQTYKGYCLTHQALTFLVCIEQVGGGRLLVEERHSNEGANDVKLAAAGSGSGLVLKGAGSIAFNRSAASTAGQELRTVYAPQLVDACLRAANLDRPSIPAPTRKSHVRAETADRNRFVDPGDEIVIRAKVSKIAATQDGEAQSAAWTFDVVVGGRALSIPRLLYNDKKAPVPVGQEMYIVWRRSDGNVPVSIVGTNLSHQWKAIGKGEIPLAALQGESSVRAVVPDAEQSGDSSM